MVLPGGGGGQISLSLSGSYGASLWKHIRKGWDSFFEHIRFVLGKGQRIIFWHDKWCGGRILSPSFPLVFSLACCKGAMVAECLEPGSSSLVSNVQFSRSANDWEVEDFSAFFSTLYEQVLHRGREDKMI